MTQVVASQLVLVANPKLAANSIAELIALAKAKPGGLNYGSTGIGNPLHLTMEMLKSTAGIDLQAVPYRGDAPLNAALIAGEIQVAVVPMATTLPHLAERPAQGAGDRRRPALAGAAQCADGRRGHSRLRIHELAGLFVPAGTPREIVRDDPARNRQGAQAADVVERLQDRRQRGRRQHARGI